MAETKIEAGLYTCNEPIQIVKKLKYMDKKNSDGTIARTYGTWTGKDNFYYFRPGTKVELTEEDLENPSLKNLILNGKIFRTL